MKVSRQVRRALERRSGKPAPRAVASSARLCGRSQERRDRAYSRIIRYTTVGDREMSLHATKGWRSRRA